MKALFVARSKGPSGLEVREVPTVAPTKGEVQIEVHACGLNFAELMASKGLYPDAPKPPFIPGYEGAGIVSALGEGVTDFKVGDRVCYMVRFGGMSDTVNVPSGQVVPLPDGVPWEIAAAIPVNYITAWHMLFNVARIRGGEKILVHMAAGGVGTAVLQLVQDVPGVVTFGTASAGKHDYVRSLGCHHPIDYQSADYVEEIKKLTDGQGVDLILDAVGGTSWTRGYGLLREGGLLVAFGLANANTKGSTAMWNAAWQMIRMPRWTPMTLMSDNRGMAGVNLGHLWHRPDLVGGAMFELMDLLKAGKIAPHIDSAWPLEKAHEGFEKLDAGKTVGKVVLLPRA